MAEVVGRRGGILGAGGRLALAGCFSIGVRMFCSVEIRGLEHDTCARHTYYALSHKRNEDPIIVLPSLLRHRGWRALASNVRFAMGSDAFTPGFLAHLLGPTLLGRAVRPFALAGVVGGLGALPVDSLLRPVEQWLRDTLRIDGDEPAGAALAPDEVTRLATVSGEREATVAARPLSALLAWRYLAELRMMRDVDVLAAGPRRYNAKRSLATEVRTQIDALSAVLQHDGSLVGAPEGGLSPDGRLRSIPGGLHQILRGAPPDTRILPVVVVYDFMRAGRPRIFVDLAPPLPDLAELAGTRLAVELRGAWLHAMRFTCTQLATGFLIWTAETKRGEFTLAELAVAICRLAVALAASGRHVDPALLNMRAARHAAAHYLVFARRHGLVRHTKTGRWLPIPQDMTVHANPAAPAYASQPLAYAWNELLDLLSAEPPAATSTEPAPHEWIRDWVQWLHQQAVPAPLHAR